MPKPPQARPRVARRRAAATLTLCLGLPGFPALAQNSGAITLPTVVVTATATPKPVVDLVSDVESVDVGRARSGVAGAAGTLGMFAGIDLTSNGGPGSTATVLLRGASAAQSLLLVDGFRVSSVSLGQPTFEAVPLLFSDRLEILRGPASGLYGSDAIGGVIQLLTPRSDEREGPALEAAAGGLGTRRLLAGYAGGARVTGQIRLSRESSDGFNATRPGSFSFNEDRDGFSRNGVLASVAATAAGGTNWRALVLQNEVDTDFDDGAFAGARVLSRVQLAGVTLEHEPRAGENWRLRVGRSTDRSETLGSFPGTYDSTQDQFSLSHTRALGPGVEMRLGFESLRESLEASTFGAAGAPSRRTHGLTLSLSGREGNHIVQLSVRRDDSDQFDTQTNGTFAYGYVLGGGWRLGGAASTGFRAPSFNDLYFPGYGRAAIRPEEATSVELGAYLDTPAEAAGDGRWRAKAVFYRNHVRDLIVYAPVCPDPDPQYAFGCADNVNRARLSGLSLSLARERGPWQWRVAADFADPKDRTLDRLLPRRARRQMSAALRWSNHRWRFGAVAKLVGERFDDPANTTRLAGYGLLDLTAAAVLGRDWEAFVEVSNVADRDYTTAAGYAQQGRVVMAGVRYPAR